ncbi:MAG TPA: hypothetical protein VEC35_07815 [Noviherbaspirillum sp.]|nr:hypothetical protein [Noviherbaspirillum sp.]
MTKYFSAASREDASLQQRQENMREQARRDAALDEALGFTFPASDPVALNCSVAAFPTPKRNQLGVTIDFFKRAWTQIRP